MNIKVKLEVQLDKVEQELSRPSSDEEAAMLQIAKATILTALQKYEK
jgi:hypothetical protein